MLEIEYEQCKEKLGASELELSELKSQMDGAQNSVTLTANDDAFDDVVNDLTHERDDNVKIHETFGEVNTKINVVEDRQVVLEHHNRAPTATVAEMSGQLVAQHVVQGY